MTAIAIFVKTPGYSPVKTRLARDTGREWAEQWHVKAALAVAEVAQIAAIGPVYWAVAEQPALGDSLWKGFPVVSQGEGGLGYRMHQVHDHLTRRHGSTVLLGADAPQIQPDWLAQASNWLEVTQVPRLCLGPAHDGGFWTFSTNRPIAAERWLGVHYSRTDTESEFRRAMTGLGEWLDLPPLTDLDRLNDLPAVKRELDELPDPLPRQVALRQWLKDS
jgi:uncharacterized protein